MSVKTEWLASRLAADWRHRVVGDGEELAEFALAQLERWDREVAPFRFPWPPPNPTTAPGPMEIWCGTDTPAATTNDDEVLKFHGLATDSPWVPSDDDLDSVLD